MRGCPDFAQRLETATAEIVDYEEKERFKALASAFEAGFDCSIGPLCALVGGIVAQEIVKAITGKFMPIKQEMCLDISELYHEEHSSDGEIEEVKEQSSRYTSLMRCFGQSFVSKIQNAKVFMIGAGAIGCELLKNFALLGLGTGPQG